MFFRHRARQKGRGTGIIRAVSGCGLAVWHVACPDTGQIYNQYYFPISAGTGVSREAGQEAAGGSADTGCESVL